MKKIPTFSEIKYFNEINKNNLYLSHNRIAFKIRTKKNPDN